MTKRDLAYFEANPDQVPDDPAEIARLLEGGELSGDDPDEGPAAEEEAGTANQANESAASGAASKQSAEGGEKPGGDGQGEQGQQGAEDDGDRFVESKDGKHRIPYSVLQTERQQRRAAEQALQELQERVRSLEEGGTKAEQPEPAFTSEELQRIAEDFPEVGKVIAGLTKQIGALEQQVLSTRESEQQRAQAERRSMQERVQEAIDGNPVLSYWQNEDADMFKVAQEFDAQIRANPRNASLSLEERFDKVAKAVQAVYGEVELPEAYRRIEPKKPAGAAKPPPAPSDAEKAADRINSLGAPKVRSLSDLPGGTPPGTDPLSELAQRDPAAIAEAMQKMTPAQVSKLLASLGSN